jgi:hypothetical protein
MKPFFPLFSSCEVKFKALSVQLSFFKATVANVAVNYYFSQKRSKITFVKSGQSFDKNCLVILQFGYFIRFLFSLTEEKAKCREIVEIN